jgi:hypothetical protein
MRADSDSQGRIAAGIALILIGLVWLLGEMGLIGTAFFKAIAPFWPIGIIIVGIAILLKWGSFAWLMLFMTLGLAIYSGVHHISERGIERTIEKKVDAVPGVKEVHMKLAYGAGTIKLSRGGSELLKADIRTADIQDPDLTAKQEGESMQIDMDRNGGVWGADEWDLALSDDVTYVIDLDYGAADAEFDLRELRVDQLDLETGATSTEIDFGRHPTKAAISAGASSIELAFPEGYPAKVVVESGLSNVELNGFSKQENEYLSPAYQEGMDHISVRIEAGASSIEGSFS